MSLAALRTRTLGFLRSTRVRTVVLLVAGYNGYYAVHNYNTLYKPFSWHRHQPGETVLDLNLDNVSVVAHESPPFFTSTEEIRLTRLISTLRAAKADPRVTGLVVRGLSGLSDVGPAGFAELRAALHDFSSGWGGKHTLLHLPSGLGSAGNGTLPLHFATVFDSVHVQPASPVIIPGLSFAVLFVKRMLDKAGLKSRTVARHEFKAAGNPFAEDSFTEPHAQSLRAVLDAFMDEIVTTISRDRGLSAEQVRNAMNDGVLSAEDAFDRGLVDRPLHRDELPQEMRTRLQERAEARAVLRQNAAAEWATAMTELRDAWNAEGGPQEAWQGGSVISHIKNFMLAVQMAIHLTDLRTDELRRAVEAQLRAFKAHLAWLDTCPWEANLVDVDENEASIYRAVTNVSSVLAVERRLVEQSIEALETFPQLVETLRKESKDDSVLELDMDRSLELVRWCRSVWRALCLSCRMVGEFTDAEEQLRKADPSSVASADSPQTEALTVAARPFLLGMLDEIGYINSLKPKELEAKEPASESEEEENTDSNVASKKSPAESRKLQYMRFSDYIDLVQTENRAYVERGVPRVKVGNSPSEHHNFFGTIDNQEKNALLRLQLAGHRLSPWRFSVPKGHHVAVIDISGPITDDNSDWTRAAIRRADKDPHVKAIVLRIDTPGGSAIASEEISRAVEVAGKPVVASMGNTCASGGYYIAAPCDLVFASPTTLTGSIGVILQAFTSAELFERLGVTSDSVEGGRFSKYFGNLATVTEWSEEFAGRIDHMIDSSYKRFVEVVARGRKMEFAQADAVARGRIWAGSDAIKQGLVDEIGGLNDAVQAAGRLAHLAPDADARAVDYPTMAMLVQEAARRRGIIPAVLDEEGDEVPPERRKRSWPWSSRRDRDAPASSEDADGAKGGEDGHGHGQIEQARTFGGYHSFGHLVFDRVLGSLDGFLMSVSHASLTANVVESGLAVALSLLGGRRAADAVVDELKLMEATANRPAAIGPKVRIE